MPTAAGKRSVFAPITALSFSADQLEDCRAFLAKRSEQTEIVPVSDAEQLLMGADGRLVEGGYRFNFFGFTALTNALVTGLGTMFKELAGEVVRRQRDNPTADLKAAVSVYNTVVRSQIETLRERGLLVDHRERVVDGFLGMGYRLLDNSNFLDIVQSEVTAKQPAAQFYRAELVGRQLTVYYIDPRSRRNDIIENQEHVFSSGWQFINGEGTNKAVHAASCVFTRFGLGVEPPVKAGGILTHSGADLAGRAASLVSRAAAREIDMPRVAEHVWKLQRVSLGLTDKTEQFQEALDKWTTYLMRLKLPRDDAGVIARNAALVGCDLKARDPVDAYTNPVLRARTGYDLLCAVLRFSRTAPRLETNRYQSAALRMMYPPLKKKPKS